MAAPGLLGVPDNAMHAKYGRDFHGNHDVTVTAGGKTKTVRTTLTGAGQTVKMTLP